MNYEILVIYETYITLYEECKLHDKIIVNY